MVSLSLIDEDTQTRAGAVRRSTIGIGDVARGGEPVTIPRIGKGHKDGIPLVLVMRTNLTIGLQSYRGACYDE